MDQQTSTTAAPRTLEFEFTGSGKEYFKIWIVNLILTILTLGVYSAWAKVRTNRYFYGNTQLAGTGFEYHANPIAILKARLIAVGLLLVYVFVGNMIPYAGVALALMLTLAAPWIIWRSMLFNARMTSYRNVRFGFYGSVKDAYKYILLLPLLPLLITLAIGGTMWLGSDTVNPGAIVLLVTTAVLAAYLMLPYIQKTITTYYINNSNYGQGKLSADLSASRYYIIYLKLIGWSLLILIGIALIGFGMTVAAGIGVGTIMQLQAAGGDTPSGVLSLILVGVALFYLAIVLFGIWTKAYVATNIRNHVYSKIELDGVIRCSSHMSVWTLFGIYATNTLLLILSLGLAYPWVKTRLARYHIAATQPELTGSLDQYITEQQNRQSALGDEMGEAFDVAAEMDLAY